MMEGATIAAAWRRQDAFLNKFYRRVVPWRHRRAHAATNRQPVVSFTFDDFPASALRSGAEILEGRGARGTYYVSAADERGFDGAGEPFTAADLCEVVARGHELACHTYAHLDCALTPPDALAADLDRNARRIAELLPGVRLANFAYPYGNVGLAAKRLVGARFASARGIWSGINCGTIDLSLLSAHKIYGDDENIRAALELIEENRRRKGWLVFFTHDVRPAPTPFGSTPAQLAAVVEAAAAAGSRILPVREALAAVGAPA